MSATYRSVFSGQQIDEAVASIMASSSLTISNDFLGGSTKAASAETTKNLNDRLVSIEDPTQLRTLLAEVPNFHLFDDAHQAKVDYTNTNFRGVFINTQDRDAKTGHESPSYTGSEICIVVDAGNGAAEIQEWFVASATWKRVKLFGIGEFDPVTLNAISTIPIYSFNTNSYNTMKVLVSVGTSDGLQRQVQEIALTHINGSVYVSVYDDIGNAQLFATNADVTNGIVTLNITSLVPNVKVRAKQIALI